MKLKEWLEASGLKQKEFADKIGVSLMSLSLYLHKGRIPRPAVMAAITRETGGAVTAADFYASASGEAA
jgi:transcriptional regulator with XRE-family HTH domain